MRGFAFFKEASIRSTVPLGGRCVIALPIFQTEKEELNLGILKSKKKGLKVTTA